MKNEKTWMIVLGVTLLIAPLVLFIAFFFQAPFSNKPEHWGQFGDYFGGIYSVIGGGATLVVLWRQFELQKTLAKDQIMYENRELASKEIASIREDLILFSQIIRDNCQLIPKDISFSDAGNLIRRMSRESEKAKAYGDFEFEIFCNCSIDIFTPWETLYKRISDIENIKWIDVTSEKSRAISLCKGILGTQLYLSIELLAPKIANHQKRT